MHLNLQNVLLSCCHIFVISRSKSRLKLQPKKKEIKGQIPNNRSEADEE